MRRVVTFLGILALSGVVLTPPASAGKPPPPPPATIGFSASSGSVAEGGTLTVTLVRSTTKGKATVTVTPVATTSGHDAAIGTDIAAASKTATFASGSGQTTVSFLVATDAESEFSETFGLQLSKAPKGVLLTGGDFTATITDNNGAPPAVVTFTLQPGDSASFSDLAIDSCHTVYAALDIGSGPSTFAQSLGCGSGYGGAPPGPVVNNNSGPMTVRVVLQDNDCSSVIYRSDSTSSNGNGQVDHARVTETFFNEYDVDLADAGGGCGEATTNRIPAHDAGNVQLHVTIALAD